MSEETQDDVPVDKLIAILDKIDKKRREITSEFENKDGELKDQRELVKNKILDMCKSLGVDSLKTSIGTVSRVVKTRYTSFDWESMHSFIKEHDAFPLLEKRISQLNMKAFLQDNPEVKIPGLNADSYYDLSFTRSRKSILNKEK
jgi:hypothetical protein